MPIDNSDDRAAKFNAGVAKLIRIGKLREGCHDARSNDNYKIWFSCLKGIRSEINSKFTKKEIDKENSEKSIADNYEMIIKLWLDNKKEKIVELNGEKGKVEQLDIYDLLFDYELWLGDIEEKYKFGMPDEENIWLDGENI